MQIDILLYCGRHVFLKYSHATGQTIAIVLSTTAKQLPVETVLLLRTEFAQACARRKKKKTIIE